MLEWHIVSGILPVFKMLLKRLVRCGTSVAEPSFKASVVIPSSPGLLP